MVLRPEYSLGHSQFNDFLFAVVGEEKSGLQLTVLSALARLGVDPWEEAARLSALTNEAATSALAAAIAALPEGNWQASDSRSIAGRLVDRLPTHVVPPANAPRDRSLRDQQPTSAAPNWMMWIALALAVFTVVSRLFGD